MIVNIVRPYICSSLTADKMPNGIYNRGRLYLAQQTLYK